MLPPLGVYALPPPQPMVPSFALGPDGKLYPITQQQLYEFYHQKP